jgi:hypothetical protein
MRKVKRRNAGPGLEQRKVGPALARCGMGDQSLNMVGDRQCGQQIDQLCIWLLRFAAECESLPV